MADVKTWCYQEDCGPIVQTGFQEQYLVCKNCRMEVGKAIKERYDSNQKPKDMKPDPNQDDLFGLYGFYNGGD